MRKENGQKTVKIRKEVIKIFKEIGFKNQIKLNLSKGSYKPYRKPNDSSLYVNTTSNHLPQIIKRLSTSKAKRLSKNSSSIASFTPRKLNMKML